MTEPIGLKRGTVSLVAYQPEWANAFEKEKRQLQGVLGDYVSGIEHVGSTSVPGLAAKPIIDMLAAVEVYSQTTSYVGVDNYDETSTSYQFSVRVMSIFGESLNIIQRLEIDTKIATSFFLTYIDFREWVKGSIEQLGIKNYDNIKLVDYHRINRAFDELDKKFPREQ